MSDAASGSSGGTSRPEISRIQHDLDLNQRSGYFPGAVVQIRHGHTTTTLLSGLARVHPRQQLTGRYRFPVASLTKSMTATLVLQLVERGQVALGDTVEQLLPGELRRGSAITVADLLAHRSGLPDLDNDPRFATSQQRHHATTAHRQIQVIADAPLNFTPGTRAEYSNSNYVVLGAIIEAVTGRSLAADLSTKVFDPAHMATASLSRADVRKGPLAHGYTVNGDVTDDRFPIPLAAGGAVMTAGDVNRFYTALFAGDLVQDVSLARMTKGRDGPLLGWYDYGYGIAQRETSCGTAYGHSGRVIGYVAEAWTLPRADTTVVVLSNRGDVGGDSGEAFTSIIDEALCS